MTQTLHRTDAMLKSAVVDELGWTPGLNSTNVGVAANNGTVTLSGEVESYPEKLRAEEAAKRVRGVTAFADEITVRGGWTGLNDTDIAREAGEALERSVEIPAGSVTATVHQHAITLAGQVPWHYHREAAGNAVRYLKGVTAVTNDITITPTASAAGIKTAISDALLRTARAEGQGTSVTADAAGVVFLNGTVHSWSERREAEHAAYSAPGVTKVNNMLRVLN